MDTDTANNPAPEAAEAEAPELASEENAPEPSYDTAEDDAGDETAPEAAEPELEEVEFNGNRYKVPKEIAPGFMMQGDYTRKTQELAEIRKNVEGQAQALQREQELNTEMLDDIAQVRFLEQRLAQFGNLNLAQLSPQDQLNAVTQRMQIEDMKKAVDARIEAKKSELSEQRERFSANLMQQAVSELSKPDPKFGWGGKFDQGTSASLTSFGQELGFTPEELRNTTHPLMIKTLHLAKLGAETLKKQQQALAKPPVQEAKPVPQVGTRKTVPAITDPDKLSPDDWLKWREKQVAKANKG
jgi:hypothetical protein